MLTVTLSSKVYGDRQLRPAERLLKSMLSGLKANVKVCGLTSRGWAQVTVSGDDEGVALRYLAEKFGLCPTSAEDLRKFSSVNGYITALGESRTEVHIDVGTVSATDVVIPLHTLQAQLTDGRKMALKKVVELFGFCENLPLNVKILDIDMAGNRAKAMLSEKQLMLYRHWTKSMLDRLIIIGASATEAVSALKATGCQRDVVGVEPLGLFECAVVCKLGTDAVGLIPKIGMELAGATFSVFNPKRILLQRLQHWFQ